MSRGALGGHPRLAFASIALMLAAIGAFLWWAATSELEEVTRGQGRVVPSSKEQVIQSLDPGVLTEMLVREGDAVAKDQVLLRIDDTRATALLRELEAKTHALSASAARARAEAYGGGLEFPAELKASPELIRRETRAYNARRRALDESVAALRNGMALLDREIEITEPLVGRGLVSEVELLRLKRQRNDLSLQVADRQNKFATEAAADLVKFEAELAQARETLVARADAARRTEIRSPMKGTVKSIRVSTIGGVIQAGQEIMTIVPTEDTLVVEAYVRPADVAFLHPGQKAVVKISAYDYAIYGGLDGVVENISPDTLRDERRAGTPVADVADEANAYYRVLVRTKAAALTAPNGQVLPIIPGMTASVEMLTGRKTVLQYLVKPLNRAGEAMRER
ncbi:HlyD family efflux transporter periplasmic adaptor subunit [Burkholderiaceae bacterium FT117]|uniref:HlyD family efflux transporter periplasmic adaptor subunit n=1 Tax=Zeimonas sediminis TaxID=2944268 RepID=UPI002342E87D|nr:HlyD family efflux transporter periplasmic adaptor subunit [Zeimonas sediminis]MCM5571740.1 HlyD family efflux transporter periplasmic adaptor subunit [Zeimonas sediminis]